MCVTWAVRNKTARRARKPIIIIKNQTSGSDAIIIIRSISPQRRLSRGFKQQNRNICKSMTVDRPVESFLFEISSRAFLDDKSEHMGRRVTQVR